MASRAIKPAGGFELWWWYFMRVSGLILVVLALGHLVIMHAIHNVETINYAFVASRWAHPTTGVLWRIWELTLCALAVMHGCNGLRQVLWEWIARPGLRKLAATLVWIVCIALIGLGTYAILLFQRDEAYLDKFRAANPQLVGAPAAPAPAAAPATSPAVERSSL